MCSLLIYLIVVAILQFYNLSYMLNLYVTTAIGKRMQLASGCNWIAFVIFLISDKSNHMF
jgi:hypothetical protein